MQALTEVNITERCIRTSGDLNSRRMEAANILERSVHEFAWRPN
jgi:hypothetical protein